MEIVHARCLMEFLCEHCFLYLAEINEFYLLIDMLGLFKFYFHGYEWEPNYGAASCEF